MGMLQDVCLAIEKDMCGAHQPWANNTVGRGRFISGVIQQNQLVKWITICSIGNVKLHIKTNQHDFIIETHASA